MRIDHKEQRRIARKLWEQARNRSRQPLAFRGMVIYTEPPIPQPVIDLDQLPKAPEVLEAEQKCTQSIEEALRRQKEALDRIRRRR